MTKDDEAAVAYALGLLRGAIEGLLNSTYADVVTRDRAREAVKHADKIIERIYYGERVTDAPPENNSD